MAISVGAQCLSDSISTGSKTLSTPLLVDVPRGSDTVTDGIWLFPFFIVENTALAYPDLLTDDYLAPTVSDAHAINENPYFNIPNQLNPHTGEGSKFLHWWQYQNTWQGISLTPPAPYSTLRTAVFCGSYFYEILHPLSTGDTITIDYSHVPFDFDTLGVQAWRVTGMRGTPSDPPNYPVLQHDGSHIIAAAVFGSPCFFPTGSPPFPLTNAGVGAFAASRTWSDEFIPGIPSTSPFTWRVSALGITGIPELGNWNGYLFPAATDPNKRIKYHFGFGYHDFGLTPVDGDPCTDNAAAGLTAASSPTIAWLTEGAGWPYTYARDTGVYLPPREIS